MVGELITAQINGLKAVKRLYDTLSEEEKKKARHEVYKKHGKYGKLLFKEVFPQMLEIDDGLKRPATSSSKAV